MEINFKWKVTKKQPNTNILSNMRPHKAFTYVRTNENENENGRAKKALQNNKRNEKCGVGRAHASHSISCLRFQVNSLLPVFFLLFGKKWRRKKSRRRKVNLEIADAWDAKPYIFNMTENLTEWPWLFSHSLAGLPVASLIVSPLSSVCFFYSNEIKM